MGQGHAVELVVIREKQYNKNGQGLPTAMIATF